MALPPIDPNNGYLPPGLHSADIHAFYARFVAAIAIPDHRGRLFAGYRRLVEVMRVLNLPTEQWIGGSFVSDRIAPNDIDLVNFCDAHAFEALSAESQALVTPYFQGKHTAQHCHCDSYYAPLAPPGHPAHELFQVMADYWRNRLGHDVAGQPKGILRIHVGEPETQPADSPNDAPA